MATTITTTSAASNVSELPLPPYFAESKRRATEIRQTNYAELAALAPKWAKQYGVTPAAKDAINFIVMIIDGQITFCLPNGELFVGGRSGSGSVDDMVRMAEFIYRNLNRITRIVVTMDTHMPYQIFHPGFWINAQGEHPAPMTMIQVEDVENGTWQVNPAIVSYVDRRNSLIDLQRYALHYVKQLRDAGRYALTIWPYHAMLGGVGHALMPVIEEALFFHSMVRQCQPDYQIKGGNPLTENYSVYRPEVLADHTGTAIAQKNTGFINTLFKADMVAAGGEAGSHCFPWSLDDLLEDINAQDPAMARKFVVLTDCISPVVVPNIVDYTNEQEAAVKRFADAGMHLAKSTDNIGTWPGSPFAGTK